MNPELKEFVIKNYPIAGRALDLGCGDGADMKHLEKMGWKCDGVDILTGTDLNNVYTSNRAPYDLVYSNYVIQKLQRPENLIKTMELNLKKGGKFFLQTFGLQDEIARKKYSKEEIAKLFASTELGVEKIREFRVWDDAPGHQHYHEILQVEGKK